MLRNAEMRNCLCALFVLMALFLLLAANQLKAQIPEYNDSDLIFALSNAYQNNPTLQSARAELRAVQEQLPQAYSGWQPTISADGSITATDIDGSNFGSASGSTAKDVGLSINQSLFRGGKTFAEVRAAKSVIQSQIASLRQTEQDVLLQGATAFMNVLRDQALLDLSSNNRDVIDKQREATQDRFDVGELTKTDVSQAEARLARAESDIITSRGNLRSAEAVFEQIIGYRPKALISPNIAIVMPQNLDEALIKVENQSPAVLATNFAHKAAEDDVDGVFAELLPEIGFSTQWNRTFDPSPGLIEEQTTRSIGLTASIPLYQSGSVRSRVREAKYTANQRYLGILEARRQIRQQVITAWEDLQASRAEIKSREAEVRAATIAQEGVKQEADFGARTILDALDADQELLDAKVALVTAQRDKTVAEFTLLSLLGLLRPETLGFEDVAFNADKDQKIFDPNIFNLDVDRIGDTP